MCVPGSKPQPASDRPWLSHPSSNYNLTAVNVSQALRTCRALPHLTLTAGIVILKETEAQRVKP